MREHTCACVRECKRAPRLARSRFLALDTGIDEPLIEMPSTCRPTTSKTVSNFRSCPGTIAPTVAGQPIQSFTGISVSMRQLSLCASSPFLTSGQKQPHETKPRKDQDLQTKINRLKNQPSKPGANTLRPKHSTVATSGEHGRIVVPRQLPISHEFSSLRLLIRT